VDHLRNCGPYSTRLLDRTGLSRGHSAVDLGCGPSGIIDLLVGRVAPGGRVVGLDADPVHVTMARQFAAEHGLGNVEVVEADARHTGLPPDSFDLVHARTLLVTIPDPAEVVAEMTRLARPGGWVAGLEEDCEHSLCYPAHPAWDRLCEIFRTAFSRTAPTRSSAAARQSSTAGQASPTSAPSAWPPCTRRATHAAPSGSTWYAACAQSSWSTASPAKPNSTSSITRCANTSLTQARW
jgi:SAM-dependent methyltransferase